MHCITKHVKPFPDGEHMKEAFIIISEVIFNGLPNKVTIISRIRSMPVRTEERRFTDIAENVQRQQTPALKCALLFFSLAASRDSNL